MKYTGEKEPGTWSAWYCLQPTFRPNDSLTAGNLATTHGHVANISMPAGNADDIYRALQAENWRPGPAKIEQLRAAGINHASLSVGDVAVSPSGHVWECADLGWTHRGQFEPAAA